MPDCGINELQRLNSRRGSRRCADCLVVEINSLDARLSRCITQGASFGKKSTRTPVGRDQIGGPLNPGSIAPIFKRVARWIGMPDRIVGRVSGHSTRVGATQDLAALDIDLAAITQAGGWKSTRMPLQYAERIAASRSAMAKAATAAGRN
jgi:hypothetical protein